MLNRNTRKKKMKNSRFEYVYVSVWFVSVSLFLFMFMNVNARDAVLTWMDSVRRQSKRKTMLCCAWDFTLFSSVCVWWWCRALTPRFICMQTHASHILANVIRCCHFIDVDFDLIVLLLSMPRKSQIWLIASVVCFISCLSCLWCILEFCVVLICTSYTFVWHQKALSTACWVWDRRTPPILKIISDIYSPTFIKQAHTHGCKNSRMCEMSQSPVDLLASIFHSSLRDALARVVHVTRSAVNSAECIAFHLSW